MQTAVIGAGAFGTALARVLAGRGHEVTIWCYEADEARRINEERESSFLPGFPVPASVRATASLAEAVAKKPLVLGVTPSHVVRRVLGDAAPHLDPDVVLVNASKGIEEGTLATVDRIYRETLPRPIAERAVFLSGPTFAKEIARGLPAAIVAASRSARSAALVQAELATDRLRVYSSEDVIGIELGGALKNVIAVGAGLSDGMGLGASCRATLITRGLAEIARLGARLGAHPLTFSGLAGVGDLVLTCTSDLSRNRTLGLEIARGRAVAEILSGMTAVAEGVRTSAAARALSLELDVDMPITHVIYGVLYEGKSPARAVDELMTRELKSERG